MEVGDRDIQVPLTDSVETQLMRICLKHALRPLDAETRRKLAEIGEAEALRVLETIAVSTTVRNLPGFINYLLRKPPPLPPSPPSRSPPPKNPRLATSPIRSPSFSRKETIAVRYYLTPPVEVETETVDRCSDTDGFKESGKAEMEALGELEFRKQFLILNYIGGNELHTVLTAEEIGSFKNLRMAKLEDLLWKRFGGKCVERQDRVLYNDWESRSTHVYHCKFSRQGLTDSSDMDSSVMNDGGAAAVEPLSRLLCFYLLLGPFLESTKTHLQRALGDENVLMVKFAENVSSCHNYAGYSKICREGILVGPHLYCFYDGGKEEKKKSPTSSAVKCFFVRVHSCAMRYQNSSYILYYKPMHERRWPFMHAHTVSSISNYSARFSLILSKTLKMSDLNSVKIEILEDVYCLDESGARVYRDGKPLIHTDGTGFISEDLALLCPKNLYKGQHAKDKHIQIIDNADNHEDNAVDTRQSGIEMHEPPMLIQCRLFHKGYAMKGTLLVNKKLEPRTIQVRHSMVKVEPDPKLLNYETLNSLEVVGTSNVPKKSFLSRNLIALLSYGGVPDSFFMDLLDIALREADSAFSNKRAAFKAALNYGNMDNDFTVARMISCGIPLEESYLQYRLSILMKEEKKSLRGGKLHIPDCFYLMGTADPTGKLKSDEVCIVLDKGQVSGKVLVYRNPGLHFGDIHILKATYIEELVSFVGNAKYAIFFPITGPRSIGDEIAGGDFDGDMYWVSMNPELLKHFKQSEAWIQKPSTGKVESKRPDQISAEELEDELIKLFLKTRFEPSFAKSEAADSWLALMDRFLTLGDDCIEEKNAVKQKLIKLIDIYYDALDAPKKGTKVQVPRDLRPQKFPHYMERENSFKSQSILGKIYDEVDAYEQEDISKKEIQKLPCFDVEVPEDYLNRWATHYRNYREDMAAALKITERVLKNEAAEEVKKKYKKLLYGAEELEESTRNINDIYNEALAIYRLSYDYACGTGSVSNCSFAWNVAGSALFKLHTMKHGGGERAFVLLPTVLKELF